MTLRESRSSFQLEGEQDQVTRVRDPEEQPDGILSNFRFEAYADAQPAWRFLGLTSHVEYTAGLLQRTIQQETHAQAALFRSLDQARRRA